MAPEAPKLPEIEPPKLPAFDLPKLPSVRSAPPHGSAARAPVCMLTLSGAGRALLSIPGAPQLTDGGSKPEEAAPAPQVTGIRADRPPAGELLAPARETTQGEAPELPAMSSSPANVPIDAKIGPARTCAALPLPHASRAHGCCTPHVFRSGRS